MKFPIQLIDKILSHPSRCLQNINTAKICRTSSIINTNPKNATNPKENNTPIQPINLLGIVRQQVEDSFSILRLFGTQFKIALYWKCWFQLQKYVLNHVTLMLTFCFELKTEIQWILFNCLKRMTDTPSVWNETVVFCVLLIENSLLFCFWSTI